MTTRDPLTKQVQAIREQINFCSAHGEEEEIARLFLKAVERYVIPDSRDPLSWCFKTFGRGSFRAPAYFDWAPNNVPGPSVLPKLLNRVAQQPIEAMSTIEACLHAYDVTGDQEWLATAYRCLEWFLGRNDLGLPLYDYRTGGCCDGLEAKGPNSNQDAESTLSWILSLARLYQQTNGQVSRRVDTVSEAIETLATD